MSGFQASPPSRGAAPLLLGEEVRLSNLLDRQTGLQELAQHKMATPSRRPLTFLLRTFLAHLSFTESAESAELRRDVTRVKVASVECEPDFL